MQLELEVILFWDVLLVRYSAGSSKMKRFLAMCVCCILVPIFIFRQCHDIIGSKVTYVELNGTLSL